VSCASGLHEALGIAEECEACLTAHCCAEAEAYIINPTQDANQALESCAMAGLPPDPAAPCGSVCGTPICTGSQGWTKLDGCPACVNANCCDSYEACATDPSCASCLDRIFDVDFDAGCCSNSLFSEWDQCLATACPGPCALEMHCS
jgi:hypothetical protein